MELESNKWERVETPEHRTAREARHKDRQAEMRYWGEIHHGLKAGGGREGYADKLLTNMERDLAKLKRLLEDVSGHWTYEDMVYRYYHQSFKVYFVQRHTIEIVEALRALNPHEYPLSDRFMKIMADGTEKHFKHSDNENWEVTRPLIEAFFHAKYFLEMAVRYGEVAHAMREKGSLPSGWAAFLYLYHLR